METKSITGISSSVMMAKNPASSSAKPWTQEEIERLKAFMSHEYTEEHNRQEFRAQHCRN
jgi:hypothetical protein